MGVMKAETSEGKQVKRILSTWTDGCNRQTLSGFSESCQTGEVEAFGVPLGGRQSRGGAEVGNRIFWVIPQIKQVESDNCVPLILTAKGGVIRKSVIYL